MEQETRFAELVAASRAVATDVAERTRQMQALSEELARSAKRQGRAARRARSRPEPPARRGRARFRRRRISWRARRRCSSSSSSGARRSPSARRSSRRSRPGSTRSSRSTDGLDKNIQAIASREQLVNAVKAEVEQVHQIQRAQQGRPRARHRAPRPRSPRSRRASTSCCRGSPKPTSASSSIDERRKVVDEVQTKANAIVHVLDDVRINLETLGEQKAVIDHVAEKATQLEFMLQEARNTLRALAARARTGGAHRTRDQAAAYDARARGTREAGHRLDRASIWQSGAS